jgi:hypothetical protein
MAEDDSTIDRAPLVCISIEGITEVIGNYRRGYKAQAQAWVEYTPECFQLKAMVIPYQATKEFVVVEEGIILNYGYIPVTVGGMFTFYLFFKTFKTESSVPT